MTAYNRQNYYNMKREAVKNAKEMHGKNNAADNSSEEKNLIGQNIQPENNTKSTSGGFSGGIFESLGIKNGSIDGEKMIIIIMIIMLAREGADLKLLLALGYILM